MREFDYITSSEKLLTPEIVQMVGSIHETAVSALLRYNIMLCNTSRNVPILSLF